MTPYQHTQASSMARESIGITQSLSPRTPGSSILPDGLLDDSVTGEHSTDGKESIEVQSRGQATIDILPDDALLEIFYFYRWEFVIPPGWWWKNLTDVCRRWRDIVYASPHFLDLQLKCTDKTPTRTSLDIWPPFPIIISYHNFLGLDDEGQDNIVAALEHHDRVIQIEISSLETFCAVTQKPFPVLTDLDLTSPNKIAPVFHEEFLGGSAPRLGRFSLRNIGFPAFPKLALSAPHLSYLELLDIPISGYISPEVMATCLTALPSLGWLSIRFQSPRSRPDRIGLPPSIRAVLPALFYFEFQGVGGYLEALVDRIDTPKLVRLKVGLFVDLLFDIPQLCKFIVRTESIRSLNSAEIVFFSWAAGILLGPAVDLEVICNEPYMQASSMARVCSQLPRLLSHVKQLDIREDTLGRGNGIDPTQFLELFHPFLAIQHLHVYGELRPLVAWALRDLTGETATQVLPSLRSLVFRGPLPSGSIQKDIQGFIMARQNSNHPVYVEWKE